MGRTGMGEKIGEELGGVEGETKLEYTMHGKVYFQ